MHNELAVNVTKLTALSINGKGFETRSYNRLFRIIIPIFAPD